MEALAVDNDLQLRYLLLSILFITTIIFIFIFIFIDLQFIYFIYKSFVMPINNSGGRDSLDKKISRTRIAIDWEINECKPHERMVSPF